MASEKMMISLEDFLKYYMKQWKLVILIVFVCTALFAGATKIVGEEITVPHSEEYLYYEKESAWLENYLKESTLMQMNPTCIYERTLFLENISDKELLKNYAESKDLWDAIESDRLKDYFYELVTWKEEETSEKVQLVLRHVTEEECLIFANYLQEKLQMYDENVQITVGESRIVKDEDLQDEQLRWYERIEYSKSLLLEAQAGYTIKVNVVAAAVTGVLCGGIISSVVVMCMFLKKIKAQLPQKNK